MTNPKPYGVTSAEQLAGRFEMRAKVSDVFARDAVEASWQRQFKHEAKLWRNAADIVRSTEFIGWKQQQEGETPDAEQEGA